MFTADGRPSDDDPREHGPRVGDERTTLVEALRRQRLTLEMRCAGLDAEAVAAGWFGPVSPHVLPRIGDVVTSASAPVAVVDSRTARPEILRLSALHGAP